MAKVVTIHRRYGIDLTGCNGQDILDMVGDIEDEIAEKEDVVRALRKDISADYEKIMWLYDVLYAWVVAAEPKNGQG